MEAGDMGDDPANDGEAEEEPLFPDEITDEYFDGLCTKITALIKELQSEQKYTLAEEFQRVLGVGQKIKSDLGDEKEKILQMHEEIAAANGKVAAAVRISQVDNETIDRLKVEIESAWKQKDIAQNREQFAQEQMGLIRDKLEKLQKDTEKLVEKSDGADELGSLGKHKEGLLRERDRLNAEVEDLNRRLQIQRVYTDEVEKKRQESEKKLKEMYKLLDQTSDEALKEKQMLEQYKHNLNEMTQNRDSITLEAKFYRNQAESHHKQIVQLNVQLAASKASIDKLTGQHRAQTEKLSKLTASYESLISLRDKMSQELKQKSNHLKLREDENKKYSLENTTLVKSKELLMKKLLLVDTAKNTLEQDILKYKNLVVTFEKERDASTRAFENMKKELEKMARERDLVRKDLMKANRIIGDQADTIMLHEQHIKTLDNEILIHLHEATKLRATITRVEKERDRNAEEIQILMDKVESLGEELHLKLMLIVELKEKIAELHAKVAQVQQLFEQTRSERNAFERDLKACIIDRDDLKEQLKTCNRNVMLLKEDLHIKEVDLARAEKTIEKLEKDKQTLKIENQNILISLQHTKTELQEKKIENERLCKTLAEDEIHLVKLRKELDTAMNEKDLIGTQMIRRNDEIGILNEKLNIIQMALDRGESQYIKRLDDIRLLKIEIANLRSQRNLLTRGLANTADMRQEVLQLNRVLTQERVKAKALEQEMTTPMNIHRWRKLEGQDPDKLDLIVKIHTLQKRLLAQTVHATEREQSLQETNKLYISMKEFILKLPSHKIKERLTTTQRVLTAKTKKLKALAAEMNVREVEEKAKACAIEELKTSLVETKKELNKQKKEKFKLLEEREREQHGQYPQMNVQNGLGYRTIGSGFKVPS